MITVFRDSRTGTTAQMLSVGIVVSMLIAVLAGGCAPKPPVASGVASSSSASAPSTAKAPTADEVRRASGTGHQPPPGSAMPPGGPKIPAQFGGKQ